MLGTSVSGLSWGAFMAVQFQVAYSAEVVAPVSSRADPSTARKASSSWRSLGCMATTAGTPDPAWLVAFARTAAAQGAIDPLAKLADDRVFVFGGTLDPVVTPPVVSALQAFYREAGIAPERLQAKTDLAAGHTFATLGFGNGCGTTAPPFIGNCDYDLAGRSCRSMVRCSRPLQALGAASSPSTRASSWRTRRAMGSTPPASSTFPRPA